MHLTSLVAELRAWAAEPLAVGRDLDDVDTTLCHRELIKSKPFLRWIYDEWYEMIARALPPEPGAVLELGSGGGFLASRIAGVVRSDVLRLPNIDVALDARCLPFAPESLRAIVMTNVLHHIPDVDAFFSDADRCLRPGGAVVMIEPWATPWSRWVYTRLHHEPFDPARATWRFETGGPMTGANSALPWIVFERDRALFERRFPRLRVASIEPVMPLRYLVSGGVSIRCLAPASTFALWRALDRLLTRLTPAAAMFACIVLRRRSAELELR